MNYIKNLLRISCRLKRKNKNNKISASQQLSQIFLHNILIPNNGIIAAYQPIDSEIDPTPLMHILLKLQHIILIPKVIGHNMIFINWQKEEFNPHKIQDIDIMIIPLVAFDEKMNRIGMGKGFYDKNLKKLKQSKTLCIGIGYENQQVMRIPNDPWDQTLDMVITEKKIYTEKCSQSKIL